MFQDEKTVELDLRSPATSSDSSRQSVRWTEHKANSTIRHSNSRAVTLDQRHLPWLIKLAAAVTILILSIWLF